MPGIAAGFGHGAGVIDVTYVRVDDAGERKTRARAGGRHAASPPGAPAQGIRPPERII